MKKVSLLILVSMILLLAFTSCDMLPESVVGTIDNVKDTVLGILGKDTHEHVWTDATCESPKTCECGETEGEALGHAWTEATCAAPKTCSVCQKTEGEAATDAHVWVEATCQAAKHCDVCGLEEGRALPHDYSEATCTAPKTCKLCNDTVGKAKSHDWAAATCTAPKTCKACNLTEGAVAEHVWVDPTCDAPKTCSGCGATEGSAKGHDWAAATCEAPKTCNTCGTTQGEPLEHNYSFEIVPQTCTQDGSLTYTCVDCGDTYRTNVVPALGHNYGDVEIGCNDSATCYNCGEVVAAVGHDWIAANCQSPKTCSKCGTSEGIPADHILSEATCMEAAVCTICGEETDIYAAHKLDQKCDYEYDDKGKLVAENLMYWCTTCGFEFPITDGDYLDGADYDGMTPVVNADRGYITASGSHLPVIAEDANGNKYYELIIKETLDWSEENNTPGQLQLWIPNNTGGNGGFNASNNATGFLSFRFNHSMDIEQLPMRLKFVDNSLGDTDPNTGESIRWGEKWCIQEEFLMVYPAGEDGIARIVGWDKVLLAELPVDENGWTGWIDLKIGVQLDPDTINSKGTRGVITLHYYINGEYVESLSKPLTTQTFGVSSVYLTGSTMTGGKGLMIDDISFGYNNEMAGAWPFDIHTCKYVVTDCTVPAICSVCGAEAEEAFGHSWISATCTEAKYCPVCNMVEGEALGHDLGGATCNDPATCSRPGCGFTSGDEVLGHDFADATCTAPKTCKREGCGATEGEALGHNYADATCTLPGTCTVCGDAQGEPLGHTFADATCEAPKTCTVEGCGATEGEPLGHKGGTAGCSTRAICEVCNKPYGNTAGHTLGYEHSAGKVTYTCTVCSAAFTTDTNFWFDGSTEDLQGNSTTNYDRGFTATEDGRPELVTKDDNSYYQLLKKDDVDQQYQIFVPHGNKFDGFADFSCANNAIGFVAFKVNVYTTNVASPFDLKLLDARGTSDWDWGKTAFTAFQITAPSNGSVTVKGYGGKEIGTLPVGEDKWTGWVDVVISIQLNSDNTMALNYYVNGENLGSITSVMAIATHKIGAIYFSGRTAELGSGFMIDDLAFGYSVGKAWTLGTCDHEWVEATCTTPKQCKTCKEVAEPALGHTGGEATCEAKAVCTRCEKEYGELAHEAAPATCTAASVCTKCNAELAPKLPHQNISWTYADGKATYTCGDCNESYVIENNWYFDGTGETPYANMDLNDENDIYATTEEKEEERNGWDTGFPIIKDGKYEVINDKGAPAAGTQGKATLWIPATNGGIDDFEGFTVAGNTHGYYSFSLSLNCDTLFEMQLVDTDMRIAGNRPAGTDFWNNGAVPTFFKVSAPANGKVSVTGLGGIALGEVAIGADGFTEWFDVTVGIEFNEATKSITLHYYIGGEYVASASTDVSSRLILGKIDGVYFQIKSHAEGTGVKFDNVVFGY